MFTLQKPVVGRWVRRYQRKVDVKNPFILYKQLYLYQLLVDYFLQNVKLWLVCPSFVFGADPNESCLCFKYFKYITNISNYCHLLVIWKVEEKEKREKREHSTTFDIRVAFSPDSVEPLWFAFIAFTRSVISMTSVNKIFCRCVFRTMSSIYDGDFPLKSHSLAGIYLLKVNNRFNTLFWFFFCWIWASKCRLGNWFRNKTP